MKKSVENPFNPGEWITLDSQLRDILPKIARFRVSHAVSRVVNRGFDYNPTIRDVIGMSDRDLLCAPNFGTASLSHVHRLREAFAAAEHAPPETLEDRVATLEASVAKILAAFASLTPPPR